MVIATLSTTYYYGQNQYNYNPARWYVGAGSDTAYLIIDFQTANSYDPPSSFMYGVLFNDSISGQDILNLVDSNDDNLTISYSGNFVDSIALGTYNGKNGVNSRYWGIWSDTTSNDRWVTNSGTSQMVYPNRYYGLSHTDFNPAIKPDTAVAVNNTSAFTLSDINFFVGSGNDTAVFVVDFLDGNSFAWGYLFNDSTTGAQMIADITSADNDLNTVVSSGFLNDITYKTHAGLSGNPYYWNTWSAKNNGIWITNIGINTKVENGDWFGCSYPNWPPAIFPTTPQSVLQPVGITEINKYISLYPNPTSSIIKINTVFENNIVCDIYNTYGHKVMSKKIGSYNKTLDLSHFANGVYTLVIIDNNNKYISKIIKK